MGIYDDICREIRTAHDKLDIYMACQSCKVEPYTILAIDQLFTVYLREIEWESLREVFMEAHTRLGGVMLSSWDATAKTMAPRQDGYLCYLGCEITTGTCWIESHHTLGNYTVRLSAVADRDVATHELYEAGWVCIGIRDDDYRYYIQESDRVA